MTHRTPPEPLPVPGAPDPAVPDPAVPDPPGRTTCTLRTFADVLAAIPYLLGFHPADSLVVLCVAGRPEVGRTSGEVLATLRADLPPPGRAAALDQLASHVAALVRASAHGGDGAVLVGYGQAGAVEPVLARVGDRLAARGVVPRVRARVEGGRYWFHPAPRDLPPDGLAVPPRASPVAAALTLAGRVVLPSRRELVHRIAPVTGRERAEMAAATARARARADRLRAADPAEPTRAGLAAVRRAMARSAQGLPLSRDEVAWLGVVLADKRVRDEAWVSVDREPAHVAMWTEVVRRVDARYSAAPAALLAWAAYQRGDGALANIALDRALTADPGYTMARLIQAGLSRGVPPDRLRLDITPEQLAAAYGESIGQAPKAGAEARAEAGAEARTEAGA